MLCEASIFFKGAHDMSRGNLLVALAAATGLAGALGGCATPLHDHIEMK